MFNIKEVVGSWMDWILITNCTLVQISRSLCDTPCRWCHQARKTLAPRHNLSTQQTSFSSLLLSGPGVDQLPMQLSWCGSNWTMANTYSTCYWEGGNILPLFKLKRVPALSSPFNYFQSNRFKLSPLFQYINIEKKSKVFYLDPFTRKYFKIYFILF